MGTPLDTIILARRSFSLKLFYRVRIAITIPSIQLLISIISYESFVKGGL